MKIELSLQDILTLIGICAREMNLCSHTGSTESVTRAYDVSAELKAAVRRAGHGNSLPKNPMNDCIL